MTRRPTAPTLAVVHYRVGRWSAAGSVHDTGTTTQDAYELSADSTADVVADRLGAKARRRDPKTSSPTTTGTLLSAPEGVETYWSHNYPGHPVGRW